MKRSFFRVRSIETGEVLKDQDIYDEPAMLFDGDMLMNGHFERVSYDVKAEFNTFKKDKFGNDIFQGDITNFGKVVFEDAGFKFEGGDYIGLKDSSEIEVISN